MYVSTWIDLSVAEIEEGDSILEHLGDVTVGPLCSSLMNLLIFVICPKIPRV